MVAELSAKSGHSQARWAKKRCERLVTPPSECYWTGSVMSRFALLVTRSR